MYFETDYWGGEGTQGAVAYATGEIIFGPRSSEQIGPIDEALKLLGVEVVPPAYDEFDAIGLRSHRQTEDWLAGIPRTDASS